MWRQRSSPSLHEHTHHNINSTTTYLGNLLLEELFPCIVLDELHGRQQLLDDGVALVHVGCIEHLVADDLEAKVVLGRDHEADDGKRCCCY